MGRYAAHVSHITVHMFQDEPIRRAALARAREAAARAGYRGRVSFAWIPGQGGRPLIEVLVFPAAEARQAG